MNGIIRREVERYAEEHTPPPPTHLLALAEQTRENLSSPQMMTGPVEGRFLEMLVFASRARRVLEIGTFSGYSSLSMAAGLTAGGHIISCEIDPEVAEVARGHIAASPYADRIEIRVGPALDTVAELAGPFDLVFIDADKAGYPAYFGAALPLLAPRGLIVLDNMLRGGAVMEPGGDEGTVAIRELSRRLAADPDLVTVLLPIRDGMTVVRRRDP